MSLGNSHSGRPKTARTPNNIQNVKTALDQDSNRPYGDGGNPILTARRNGLGISPASFSRIVHDDLHYHPYKPVTRQLSQGSSVYPKASNPSATGAEHPKGGCLHFCANGFKSYKVHED